VCVLCVRRWMLVTQNAQSPSVTIRCQRRSPAANSVILLRRNGKLFELISGVQCSASAVFDSVEKNVFVF